MRLGWFDGLRGRIAAVLLGALLVQFIGGEILFNRLEQAQMERGRTRFLTDHVAIAGKLAVDRADAETMRMMGRLWQDRLTVNRLATPPPPETRRDSDDLAFIRARFIEAQPRLDRSDLRLSKSGNALEGAILLEDGTWLGFRSDQYFSSQLMFLHYTTSILLLLVCAGFIAAVFGRMIGRPLRQLVEASEKVGRDEPVLLSVEGPREVRQVAGAFEAMQGRLLAHVKEQVQSLAAMSHDLRTPLARLRLNASMVKDAELRVSLEEDVDEMEAFVASVLDYLRGDEGEEPQRIDVASILVTIVDEALDDGQIAEYSGPGRLEIVTRPVKLKRIVRNVVQNATRHAGNARVGLSASDDEVIITVDDDGPGIAEADIETVFQPFTRIDSSRNRATGGSGLGLAIARRLVTRMGGSISLRNRSEGGLNLTIRLPRISPDTETAGAPDRGALAGFDIVRSA